MKPVILSTLIGLNLTLTAGCSGTGAEHQPVLSAVPDPSYQSDLAQCRSLAKSQKIWNPETGTQAAIGAAIGALAGMADETGNELENAIAGGVVGGAAGAGAGALEMRHTREDILIRCLRDKGHPVVG
ncbi:MAG: glycine zipper family protein [Marinibacterium sp.]